MGLTHLFQCVLWGCCPLSPMTTVRGGGRHCPRVTSEHTEVPSAGGRACAWCPAPCPLLSRDLGHRRRARPDFGSRDASRVRPSAAAWLALARRQPARCRDLPCCVRTGERSRPIVHLGQSALACSRDAATGKTRPTATAIVPRSLVRAAPGVGVTDRCALAIATLFFPPLSLSLSLIGFKCKENFSSFEIPVADSELRDSSCPQS